jgi:phosphoglycolate phosphatase
MKTLIFDFDGTLGDSFELVLEIAYELTGLEPLSEEEIARLRHMPIMKAVREVGIPLRHAPRLVLHGRQMMQARMSEVHAFAGVPEAIKHLHQAGHHMLIVSSNSEQNVRAFLRANELESYFDGVYGGVGLLNKAKALKKVLRQNKLKAEDCFYIGDEVRDILAAQKVHLQPISVAWGYQAAQALEVHRPFALITTPGRLVELLDAEV